MTKGLDNNYGDDRKIDSLGKPKEFIGDSKLEITNNAEKEIGEIHKELLIKKLNAGDLQIDENSISRVDALEISDFNDRKQSALLGLFRTLFEKSIFLGDTFEEFDGNNPGALNRQDEIVDLISHQSRVLYKNIRAILGKENFNEMERVNILGGKIHIYSKNQAEVQVYQIDVKKGNGVELALINQTNFIEQKHKVEQREEEANIKKLDLLGGTLSLGLVVGLLGEMNLRDIEFTDADGKNHKLKIIKREIKGNEAELIKKALQEIKEQTGYEVKYGEKEVKFEKGVEKLEVSKMRNLVKKWNFDEFMEKMKESGMTEQELKDQKTELRAEFEKNKSAVLKFINGVENRYGGKISAPRMMRRIMIEAKSIGGSGIHLLLFPIFFTAIHKNGGNLESYFKGAAEYALFMGGAQLVGKGILAVGAIKNVGKMTSKLGLPGRVLGGIIQLTGGVAGGGAGVAGGAIGAGAIKLQKSFDSVLPESEDYFYKIGLHGENDSATMHLASTLGTIELADWIQTDVGIKGTPLTFWSHEIDASTNRRDYMDIGFTRTPIEFNKRVDAYLIKIIEELDIYINAFNKGEDLDFWDKTLRDNLTSGPDMGDPTTGDEIGKNIDIDQLRRQFLEDKIKDYIFTGENAGIEEENTEIKQEILTHILGNLDNMLHQNRDNAKKILTAFLSNTLDKMRINHENIIDMEDNFIEMDLLYKELLGINAPINLKEDYSLNQGKAKIESLRSDPTYDLLKSLPEKDKSYLQRYYQRLMDREQLIADNDNTESEKDYDEIKGRYTDVLGNDKIVGLSIYDRLLNDNTSVHIGDKITTKGELFHQFTLQIKELKREKFFIERLKKREVMVDLGVDGVDNYIKYEGGSEVKKEANKLSIIHQGKQINIYLNEYGKLDWLELGGYKYIPNISNTLDRIFTMSDGSTPTPFIYFNKNKPELILRRENLDYSEKFSVSSKISFSELVKILEKKDDFTLIKDYELYFDLELEIDN